MMKQNRLDGRIVLCCDACFSVDQISFDVLEFMLLRDGDINETMKIRDEANNENVSHRIKYNGHGH